MAEQAARPAIPWREMFALDLRSLALLRVALGVLLLLDWVDRLPDLRAHYSDEGVLPRAAVDGVIPVSVQLFSGAVPFQAAVAGLALALAALLVVGWRTPVVLFLSWLLLLGAHGRNAILLQGGDMLLRLLLFWGLFLPLGACWSVDGAAPEDRPKSPTVLSPATFAFIAQLCLVYFFAAAWKWAPEWRDDGTAVHQALSVARFTSRLGLWLRGQTELCRWLTYGTLWLEALGPAVLLLPFSVARQRLFAIAAFLMFHTGLAITLELGNFPWVCMAAWLALLPGAFWDKLQAQLGTPRLARWWQSMAARLARRGGGEPPPWAPPRGALASTVVLLCLAYAVLWNVRSFDHERNRAVLPDRLHQLGWVLGLDQGWGLFAPRPGRLSGWFLIVGTCADGTEVDLYNGGGPVDRTRPALISATYPNGRWRKMIEHLGSRGDNGPLYPALLVGYAGYLYRDWNRDHDGPRRLRSVDFIYLKEEVTPPGQPDGPAEPVHLYHYEPGAGR